MKTLTALICRLLLAATVLTAAAGFGLLALNIPWLAMLAAGLAAAAKFRRWRGSGWAFGTARVADIADMAAGGMLSDDGLILGRVGHARPTRTQGVRALFNRRIGTDMACRLFLGSLLGPRWISDRFIRVQDYVHLITFAPSGAGKGVSAIIPNLMTYRGSVVVTDPSGSNYRATAKHRQNVLGQQVFRLDPFGVCGPGSDQLNPFDLVNAASLDFSETCRELANMLVVRKGDEKDPHWNDSAEISLAAFIALIAACEVDADDRNLQTLRNFVSSKESYCRAVKAMQGTEECDGFIRRLGDQLDWFIDRELGSVMTTVNRHTQFLDSPPVKANTSRGNFDPRLLRTGKTSVYLILPPEKLETLAPLMRLWIGCIMHALVRQGADESRPVLFFLDEAAHLGRMKILDAAPALLRSYGVRLWFFFQSMNQLEATFGDHAKTVLDNMGTQQYFGICNYHTAEEISRRIGDTTVTLESVAEADGHSWATGFNSSQSPGNRSTNRTVTCSETGRRLIKPEEIMTMPRSTALIFHQNMPVSLGFLPRYYDAPEFQNGGTGRNSRLGIMPCGLAASLLVACGLLTLVIASASSTPPSSGYYADAGFNDSPGDWPPALPFVTDDIGDFQPYEPSATPSPPPVFLAPESAPDFSSYPVLQRRRTRR